MTRATVSRMNTVRVLPVPMLALKQMLPATLMRYDDAITSMAGTVASMMSGMSVKIPMTCFGNIANKAMMEMMMA